MPRPAQLPAREPLTQSEIAQASYVGSKEHKAKRWWGGLPGAHVNKFGKATRPKKLKTTICWMLTRADQATATGWVQDALRLGQFRLYEGDKTYPKHIWYRDAAGQHWFGFCVNGIAGTYKGWPIDGSEKREIFG
jgi:hypothetical protein